MGNGLQDTEEWTRTVLYSVAAFSLSQTIHLGAIHPTPEAMFWLAIGSAACLYGTMAPAIRAIESHGRQMLLGVMVVGLAVQFGQFLISPPGLFAKSLKPYAIETFIAGVTLSAALVLCGVTGFDRSGRKWFPAVILVHFLLGVWFLRVSPPVTIDVLMFQQDASKALLHGANPYSLAFPNVYGENTPFYGAGVSVNGRLAFGFPYPPLSLFLCLPGELLAGDVRYSHLLAISLSGLIIGGIGKGLISRLAAVTYVFSPRIFFVLQMGWTEPFVVLLLSLVVLASTRLRRPSALLLGLLLASKQYLLLACPAAWLLIRKPSVAAYTSLVTKSGAIAAAVTLPLALWNFPAFFRSVVMWQFVQPFRADALSIPAWLVGMGFPRLPVWAPFAAAIAVAWVSIRTHDPTPANFAGSLAAIYLTFFVLSKQAFSNYYFFVLGCLCCAIAAGGAANRSHREGAYDAQRP